MNDTNQPTDCQATRPLLFAAAEGEIDRSERLAVHAHLAVCDACRSWERGERALTALLSEALPAPVSCGVLSSREPVIAPGRPRVRSRLLASASACLAAALALLILPAAKPSGSLVQRQLGPGQAWQLAVERILRGPDVIAVPAAAAATVRLGDDVQLDAIGPARFALDTVGGVWQVSVDDGTVVAAIRANGVLVVGGDGAQRLAAGTWRLSPDRVVRQDVHAARTAEAFVEALVAQSRQQDPVPRSASELFQNGIAEFGAAAPLPFGVPPPDQHMVAAERLLRAAVEAEDASPEVRRQARFYLACSISRQGRAAEAFELEREWLERYPKGHEASLVRFYMAAHLRDIGRTAEARRLFERVLRDEGETSLGTATRSYLDVMGAAGAPKSAPDQARPSRTGAAQQESLAATRPVAAPRPTNASGYLVVPVDLQEGGEDVAGFVAAAGAAKEFHHADSYRWDGRDFETLEQALRERAPANVLFVLRPKTLDLVLHRQLLLLSARIDDDWFCDFAFGYLTAEDGDACQRLWQRIEQVHRRGQLSGTWWQGSVATLDKSLVYQDAAPPVAAAAGLQGPHYYYGTGDPEHEAMVAESLQTMQKAVVVEFTGCGDPQGIWLFSDQRNLKRELHWDYRPDRVGEDADGSMPRLLAARFRDLQLDAPILWSGTCHSGAVDRVFVEGDIVSTFGRTERATVHHLTPDTSLALSWLAAGAASLLVPLGANHGMSVTMEVDFALRNGASLGETIQSTWDDVLLAAEGQLVLDLPVEGEPHRRGEAVMQGGGANRILIGDPALRPFRATPSAAEQVEVARTDKGLAVTVRRAAGWQPRSWDMFGSADALGHRVLVRVDLTALGLGDCMRCEASVAGTSQDGAPLPFTMRRAALEDDGGRRYLHLQANGPRAELDRNAATVVFEVVAGG